MLVSDLGEQNRRYIPSIDIVKALAIIGVLLTHTIDYHFLNLTGYIFHINQAVPVFMVLSGVTLMLTFGKSGKMYSLVEYFRKRIRRFIFPFLIIFVISLLFGVLRNNYYIGFESLIGSLPVSGPGNYYVTIVIELLIIAPILIYFYKKTPRLLIVGMVLSDLFFELLAPHLSLFANNSYLYEACILRYFAAIALGMFIAEEYLRNGEVNLKNKKYLIVLLFLPIAIIYLCLGLFFQQPFPFFETEWGTQNISSFTYTLVIVTILLNSKIEKYFSSKTLSIFTLIGKSSYHIFLVQILFFGFGLSIINILPSQNMYIFLIAPAIAANLIIIISFGIFFYEIDSKIVFCRKRWQRSLKPN